MGGDARPDRRGGCLAGVARPASTGVFASAGRRPGRRALSRWLGVPGPRRIETRGGSHADVVRPVREMGPVALLLRWQQTRHLLARHRGPGTPAATRARSRRRSRWPNVPRIPPAGSGGHAAPPRRRCRQRSLHRRHHRPLDRRLPAWRRHATASLQRLAGANAVAPSAPMSQIQGDGLYVNHDGSPPLLDRRSGRGAGRAAPTYRGDALAREGAPSPTCRRASSSRRSRHSPATGRPSTTSGGWRRG
jgi:hypothetical protein